MGKFASYLDEIDYDYQGIIQKKESFKDLPQESPIMSKPKRVNMIPKNPQYLPVA